MTEVKSVGENLHRSNMELGKHGGWKGIRDNLERRTLSNNEEGGRWIHKYDSDRAFFSVELPIDKDKISERTLAIGDHSRNAHQYWRA